MTPQFQIWQREHDQQWCLCIWEPREISIEEGVAFKNDETEWNTYTLYDRVRSVYPTLQAAIAALQKGWG